MRKKLQIFISSTYIDMKEERQAAVEAILKSGNIPAGMELFTSGNESQLQAIMRWIDDSDIYVLLLGGRYGSIEKSSELSYTEIEYDYAVSQKKPFFSIVIEEEALEKKIKLMGKDAIEQNEPAKLVEFRKKVLSNMSSFYNETKDIKLAIHETLQDFKDRYSFSGWVSGKKIEELENVLEENRSLRIKLDEILKESNNQVEPSKVNNNSTEDNIANEFEELIQIFQNMKIKTPRFSSDGLEREYDLLSLITHNKARLINGVYNRSGMTEVDKVFFFNIFPKLAVHELAENTAVPNFNYRRFVLNKKGLKFLAFVDKKVFKPKK